MNIKSINNNNKKNAVDAMSLKIPKTNQKKIKSKSKLKGK